MQLKLEQLNSKFNIMANSKAELSAQLVDCEEEKLKATKSYIDMQIQNNKLREEMESTHYELNNKVRSQSVALIALMVDRRPCLHIGINELVIGSTTAALSDAVFERFFLNNAKLPAISLTLLDPQIDLWM